jgi:hypothetical protein
MTDSSGIDIEELVLPFRAHGIEGRILVDLATNDDPVETGHNLVAAGYEEESFKGFPVVTAHVDYDGTGYRRLFGWIQLITHVFADTGREPYTEVDWHPTMMEGAVPLFPFGYLPMFFDAPANPGHPDMRWLAETFLAYSSGENEIVALVGFGWGYDLRAGRPTRLPLTPAGPDRWNAHLPHLSKVASTWNFRPDFNAD